MSRHRTITVDIKCPCGGVAKAEVVAYYSMGTGPSLTYPGDPPENLVELDSIGDCEECGEAVPDVLVDEQLEKLDAHELLNDLEEGERDAAGDAAYDEWKDSQL